MISQKPIDVFKNSVNEVWNTPLSHAQCIVISYDFISKSSENFINNEIMNNIDTFYIEELRYYIIFSNNKYHKELIDDKINAIINKLSADYIRIMIEMFKKANLEVDNENSYFF